MPPLPKEKEILFFYHASTQLNSPTQNHSHTLLDLMQRCYIIYLYLLHIVYNIHTIYTIYQQANSASRATFTISSYCPQPLYGIQLGFQHWSLSIKLFLFFYSFRAKLAHPYCFEEKMLIFLRQPSQEGQLLVSLTNHIHLIFFTIPQCFPILNLDNFFIF